jgi:hypothetical protein
MDDITAASMEYESVPSAAVRLFRMSWQLELWLREITYVELRASRANWKDYFNPQTRTKLTSDRKLSHMATGHENEISYLSFGQLCDLLKSNWELWSEYFPPLDNLGPRLEEVKTIRNRVAHCRRPHENDERRLDLFLRDLDPGIRQFCLRYTSSAYPDDTDPVATSIAADWPNRGYATELLSSDIHWLYAQPQGMEPRLGVHVMRQCRLGTSSGTIYRINLHGRRGNYVDVLDLLHFVVRLDREPIHAIVTQDQLDVTLSATLGHDRVAELIAQLIERAKNVLPRSTFAEAARRTWPEWVLFPNHPLALFDSAYTGPMLDLG